MIRALIFDLDDTLYIEEDFFKSGFGAVARLLESRGVGCATELKDQLLSIHLMEGREGVFDKAAARLAFPRDWIPELISLFRSHAPTIQLAPDVAPVLARLRERYLLGCITDGWADVQRRKIDALAVTDLIDTIVIADDKGREFWKPSSVPFEDCCARLGVSAGEAVYVGDHPERDVGGACNAGIACVRIRRERGYFRQEECTRHVPAFEIETLAELPNVLDRMNGRREAP